MKNQVAVGAHCTVEEKMSDLKICLILCLVDNLVEKTLL